MATLEIRNRVKFHSKCAIKFQTKEAVFHHNDEIANSEKHSNSALQVYTDKSHRQRCDELLSMVHEIERVRCTLQAKYI